MAPTSLEKARSAFDNGDYEETIAILDKEHRWGRMSATSVRLAHDAYMKMGELHRALGEANRLRSLAPGPQNDGLARRLLGKLVETDPTWIPRVGSVPSASTTPGRRILHFLKESVPYSETGFTMRSRMTLAAQQLAGYVPEVITSLGFPRSKGLTDFPTDQVLDGIRYHHLDLGPEVDVSHWPADVSLEANARMAAEIADDFSPNVIQAGTGYRGFETALMGIALSDRYQVPFVYEVRGFQEATWTGNVQRSEKGEYYRRRHQQETRCMTRADRVITIAEAMAIEIAARGIPSEKLAVVPNAIDVRRFTPRAKRTDLIERYGLEDRFVIGYISNLGAREGIDQLIRAVGILRSEGEEIVCFIAGDGPERQRLDRLVAELDLAGHVVLAGHVPNEQIEDHYALIDLFVVPRIDDRAARLVTPLKPLEAMAMGLPVIASSLPALDELVAPGERGMSFPPSDPVALASVITTLADDHATRNRFAAAGQAWVRSERTLEANARRYGQILEPLF
jgi:glycosyltransferase involved in cell wall biosynthesis